MKKIYLPVIILIIAIVVTGLLLLLEDNTEKNIVKANVGNQIFTLELADTPTKRSKGLSGRNSLPDNAGMLFVFEEPGKPFFWMKDMQFNLDFLWIDGTIIKEITTNVPSPQNANGEIVQLTPSQLITSVIEVRAGTTERLEIKPGDKIEIIKEN